VSIAVRAQGVGYRVGTLTILDNVSLDLHRGEVVCIVGPNGAGKSTLVSVLAGLVQPHTGTVACDGRVAAALQAPVMARRSVEANVTTALSWWGVPAAERRDRARAALAELRVEHLAQRPASTISGGEARRVHLARAIATRPDTLLLDEPFAGLDAATRADLLYAATGVLRRGDRATLVVVHDRAEAWALADRVVVMLAGRIHADGDPRSVFLAPPTIEVARFVGFDGEIATPTGIRLVRPSDVTVTSDGPLVAHVERVIPVEDGARVELRVDNGRLVANTPLPAPQIGEALHVTITGSCYYALDGKLVERDTIPGGTI
jgi:ABC-type sugar transport system ATPase subunit